MLKFLFFGIGFVLVFEGFVYFLFSKNIKKMFEAISQINHEKIRNFSLILIISGLCIIYITLKNL